MKDKNIKPDLLFIGSSQAYRQIDPEVVSEIFNKTKNPFNLGAPATFCPQSYYLIDNILYDNSISENLKYLVVELNAIELIENSLMTQERGYYWLTFGEYSFVLKSIWKQSNFGPIAKACYTMNFSKAYIYNFLNIGQYSDQMMSDNYYDQKYLGPRNNGFAPIEEDLEIFKDSAYLSALKARKQGLISNPEILTKRLNRSIEIESNNKLQGNSVHLERLLKLIKSCNDANVSIVFLLPPRISSERSRAIFNMLDDKNKIDLNSGSTYPEFYNIDLSFDKGHLNSEGARIYSNELGKKLLEKFK